MPWLSQLKSENESAILWTLKLRMTYAYELSKLQNL